MTKAVSGRSSAGDWRVEGARLKLVHPGLRASTYLCDVKVRVRQHGWTIRPDGTLPTGDWDAGCRRRVLDALRETGLLGQRFATRREALIAAATLVATDAHVRVPQ